MSLNIRYLTNGKKSVYVVTNSGVTPMEVSYFDKKEDIPESIRNHAPVTDPQFVGPDLARIFKAQSVLYPDFPDCKHPKYTGKNCVAEACRFAPGGVWTKCPYFPGYEVKE